MEVMGAKVTLTADGMRRLFPNTRCQLHIRGGICPTTGEALTARFTATAKIAEGREGWELYFDTLDIDHIEVFVNGGIYDGT